MEINSVKPWSSLTFSAGQNSLQGIDKGVPFFFLTERFQTPQTPPGCGGSLGIWTPVLLTQLAYSCIKGKKRDSVFQDVSMYH